MEREEMALRIFEAMIGANARMPEGEDYVSFAIKLADQMRAELAKSVEVGAGKA